MAAESAAGRIEVGAGNAEMAAAWGGDEGDHWAEHADRYEAASAAFTRTLLEAAAVGERARVLDVGCGAGGTTLALGRTARAGAVLGVDLSSQMLAVGRAAADAEGLAHVRFEQADAQVHEFAPAAFDVVVSNFGAMFFADPVAAFANIRRGMSPGASVTMLAWREIERNEWISMFRDALAAGRQLPTPPPGAQGPFSMADPDVTRERLQAAGFEDVTFTPANQTMNFGKDADDAWPFVSTFGIVRGLTGGLDDTAREDALAQLRRALEEHETGDGVRCAAAAWLITANNGGAAVAEQA